MGEFKKGIESLIAPSHYQIEFSAKAARQYRKLPLSIQEQLKPHIDSLENEPRPSGIKKLKGTYNGYRLRVGDYRILYEVQDNRLLILVVEVAHRRESYR